MPFSVPTYIYIQPNPMIQSPASGRGKRAQRICPLPLWVFFRLFFSTPFLSSARHRCLHPSMSSHSPPTPAQCQCRGFIPGTFQAFFCVFATPYKIFFSLAPWPLLLKPYTIHTTYMPGLPTESMKHATQIELSHKVFFWKHKAQRSQIKF